MKHVKKFNQFDVFSNLFFKWGDKVKAAVIKFAENISKEVEETKIATAYVIRKYKDGETLTEEENEAVRQQFYDVLKMVGIGIPFSLIPGASVLLPILMKVAEKHGINLFPSAFNEKEKTKDDI